MIMKSARKLYGAIDLGTTKVAALVAEEAGGALRVVGAGLAPSEGMRQGVVVDIERASVCVARAVAEAERMAGATPRTYNVGAAGEHVRSMNSRGVVSVGDIEKEIAPEDVARAFEAARKFSLPQDREIIHTLPQEFIVDSQRGIRQPAGMFGARLEARVHVVTASRPALDNLAKTLLLAGVEVGDIVLEPLASATAVLSADEREHGAIVLDVGGGTTDVLVVADGGVLASGVIGLGGHNITSDVAYGLRTSPREAERLKVEHGSALSTLVAGDEVVQVSMVAGRGPRRVAKTVLSGIIEPRVSELFGLIDQQIAQSGLKRSLRAGVVLTGGSAMLTGIRELAEQVFDLPARVASPTGLEGLSEVVAHPRFSTAVGLLRALAPAVMPGERASERGGRLASGLYSFKRAIASFI
ncbi:MAG TPA: cell division protein FtsA [Candidatus Krumholzibacteria bacterium]|nr:cell division protein FtsA [Candidatus Krumholzibacteria bacterium]